MLDSAPLHSIVISDLHPNVSAIFEDKVSASSLPTSTVWSAPRLLATSSRLSEMSALISKMLYNVFTIEIRIWMNTGNNDGWSTHSFSCQKTNKTNGPSSTNEDFLSDSNSSSAACVDGNRKRFQKSSFFHAHVIREFVAKIGSVSVVTCQIAIKGWSCTENNVQAQIVTATLAVIATPTRNSRFDCNTITC